jgi:NADPH:quinone reductase-like Zn-dependent oxidoreductase
MQLHQHTPDATELHTNETMQAVVCRAYGGPEVLAVETVAKPRPSAHELLIEVHATTVTAACAMMRRGDTLASRLVLGAFKPRKRFRVMGIELAGEVVAVGPKVTRFRPGDRVFGFAGFSLGAYAQFVCLSEDSSLVVMPPDLAYDEAASLVDGPTTALYFLRDRAALQPGARALIIGASGSIGTAAVQLAAALGADVSGVCSGGNAALVRSLGARHVFDYTQEDFTQSGQVFDVVFDTIGKSSFRACRPLLAPRGRYLVTTGSPLNFVYDAWSRMFGQKKFIFGMSVHKHEALREVSRRIVDKTLRPVIDRRYALSDIVEAHRYAESGHKRGNVVVTMPP